METKENKMKAVFTIVEGDKLEKPLFRRIGTGFVGTPQMNFVAAMLWHDVDWQVSAKFSYVDNEGTTRGPATTGELGLAGDILKPGDSQSL